VFLLVIYAAGSLKGTPADLAVAEGEKECYQGTVYENRRIPPYCVKSVLVGSCVVFVVVAN